MVLCVFCVGCSTLHSRIEKQQFLFSSFSPEIQAQIQNGRIAKEFTEDMVYLAKGEPAEKIKVKKNQKMVTLWKYPGPYRALQPGPAGPALSTPFGHPQFGPTPTHFTPLQYDRKYYTVEFEDGKVTTWDHELQVD